jgi:AAA domain, putative AbiEii toxin, Type IV TA system
VTKPWEITAQDIETWAERVDATALLPKLVRRLLLATQSVDAIDIRADAGTRLGGWDGVVRTREEGLFCPVGVSAWEMSTEGRVRQKLNEDFEKRTSAPGDIRPSLGTYVAVTARTFDKKDAWAREKKAIRRWADVRLLDADDLATWMEQAPGVALWFAEHLGRPTGASELDAFLHRWRDRTEPPVPHALVLAGNDREQQAGALRASAQQPAPLPLFVQAETRDEAALFAAAALAADGAGGAWAERALIVESADTFAWLTRPRRAEPLLAILAFDSPDIGRAAGAPVRLIVPVDTAASPPLDQTLRLARQPYPPLVRGLMDHGWEERKAARLVEQAGGSLTALQHLCGYFVPPEWARDVPQPELIAFLLVGAWTPTNEADRNVVRRFGADPAELERWCATSMRGPWVEQVHDRGRAPFFRWRALPGAWLALGPALAGMRSWRTDFFTIAKDVLGEPDPALDMPKEQRFYAAVQGKVLRFSAALREGIATSLIQLALSTRVPEAASWSSAVVRDVLDKDLGWKAWASLDRLLPQLAEAAPRAFLKALDDSLDRGDSGVAHVFAEEGGMLGSNLHAGLLWALESLAWLEDFGVVQGTVLALARLAEVDGDGWQPGKVANRPLASLEAVLDAAIPQSSTTAEQRLSLLRLLCQRHHDVAWKVLNASFDIYGMPRMVHQGPAPAYRHGGPKGDFNRTTREDFHHQLAATITLWLEHAGIDAERWASALEPARHFPEPQSTHVLDTLAERADRIQDTNAKVWAALRARLDLFFRSEEQRDTERARLEALYTRFEPPDIVSRVAWLFGKGDELPEKIDAEDADDWEKRQTRLTELRRSAVAEIYASNSPWETISRLAESVEFPELLGAAMAESPFGSAMDGHLFELSDVGPLTRVVPSFFAVRALREGYNSGRMEWVAATLQRLVSLGRVEEAGSGSAALMPRKWLWDFLDEVGDPLKTAYWKALKHVFGEHSIAELERALRELVQVGRAHEALGTASRAKDQISGEIALFVLGSLRDQWQRGEQEPRAGSTVAYSVRRLFAVLDRDPPEDLGIVANLELAFLSLLDDHRDGPKRPLVFGRMLASSPELFIKLLVWMYRPKGTPPNENVASNERNAANNAYRLLNAWKGYPGEGLDGAAREEALEKWCRTVFDLASKEGRGEISVIEIANVLARAPEASDGHWPCLAARLLLEARALPELDGYLLSSEYNRRSARLRPVAPDRERAVAEQFRTSAEALRDDFPRTARMLGEIADSYEHTAERWELEGQEDRIRYGEHEAPAAPSHVTTSPDETVNAGPVRRLETRNIGPAKSLVLDLAPRLNLLTGDNSLGKTFVLEVLFWTLTGAWPPGHAMAQPEPPKRARNAKSNGSAATAQIVAQAGDRSLIGTYDFKKGRWAASGTGSLGSGLVVYARVDGGFSVWDPLRNTNPPDTTGAMSCFHFGRPTGLSASAAARDTGETLWEGLRDPSGKPICNGLIADAVQWRDRKRDAFARLKQVLEALSPPEEPIQFDSPKRLAGDSRDHPRLLLPYGPVYAVHAAAAVKRVLGLAYALVWAVEEMREAAAQMDVEPPARAVLLIDEIETHLHPKWQRTILGAVLAATVGLLPKSTDVQIIATTHAPLVITSAEDLFDAEKDALFHFDTTDKGASVTVEKVAFHRYGEADAWLTSPVFGLRSTRSPEAESVLEMAAEAMKNGQMDRTSAREINEALKRVLSELDPFWMRWRYIAEKRGWIP